MTKMADVYQGSARRLINVARISLAGSDYDLCKWKSIVKKERVCCAGGGLGNYEAGGCYGEPCNHRVSKKVP